MDDIEIFMRSAGSGLLLYVLAPSVRLFYFDVAVSLQ